MPVFDWSWRAVGADLLVEGSLRSRTWEGRRLVHRTDGIGGAYREPRLFLLGNLCRIGCGPLAGELCNGESVAIDGVCLTIIRTGKDWFEVEITPETLRRTTWDEKSPGAAVNLERALRAGERLGGHLVQGHVDGVATVTGIRLEGRRSTRSHRASPRSCFATSWRKGPWRLDGVSLTVASVSGAEFDVALIPHTLRATTLGEWRIARRIHVEVDLIAKYVESPAPSLFGHAHAGSSPMSRQPTASRKAKAQEGKERSPRSSRSPKVEGFHFRRAGRRRHLGGTDDHRRSTTRTGRTREI
jgi:riboflavin synthase